MDIPAVNDFQLIGGETPKRIPTGIYGPLPLGTFGLLTGRSSLTAKGVIVHMGIIDADYQGEIQILMSSIVDYSFKKGERIAQILLLPYISIGESLNKRQGGFGSTNEKNVFWTTRITSMQPRIKFMMNKKSLIGLLDTGSDITIINKGDWPKNLATQFQMCHLRGVNNQPITQIEQSSDHVQFESMDGQIAVLKPYILHLPINILGRNILEQWEAYLQI